jgi:hypothetical protein
VVTDGSASVVVPLMEREALGRVLADAERELTEAGLMGFSRDPVN